MHDVEAMQITRTQGMIPRPSTQLRISIVSDGNSRRGLKGVKLKCCSLDQLVFAVFEESSRSLQSDANSS